MKNILLLATLSVASACNLVASESSALSRQDGQPAIQFDTRVINLHETGACIPNPTGCQNEDVIGERVLIAGIEDHAAVLAYDFGSPVKSITLETGSFLVYVDGEGPYNMDNRVLVRFYSDQDAAQVVDALK